MRQTCGTEHQAETERERGYRIFHQPTRAHDRFPFGCTDMASVNRLLKLNPTCFITIKAIKLAPNSSSTALMICTRWWPACRRTGHTSPSARPPAPPRCGSSGRTAARSAYPHPPSAQSGTAPPPPANRRRRGYESAPASGDRRRRQQRYSARVTQALGNQEQNDRPADEEAEGVDQAVIP